MKLKERRRAKTSSIYLVNNRKRIFTAVFPLYARMSTLDYIHTSSQYKRKSHEP